MKRIRNADAGWVSDPKTGVGLPKVAYGRGIYVYDVHGNRYIDASGGPAVYSLGHGNEEVNEAIKSQLDRIAHGYRYNFSSDALEELTEIIRRRCGGTLAKARLRYLQRAGPRETATYCPAHNSRTMRTPISSSLPYAAVSSLSPARINSRAWCAFNLFPSLAF